MSHDGTIIPLFKVFMGDTSSLHDVLHSGYIGQGQKVEEFEKVLGQYLGNPEVKCLNSATSGIHLAIHMAKDGLHDEVITTPLTCVATNLPIVANHLKIRWADVDPNTCNVDLSDVRRKIGPKTLAILVVHWGGYPVDLDGLRSIQDECHEKYGHRPIVIEDCAHALGSMYKGRKLGNHGNICIFSFQAIKHLTTGDGGAIVSPSPEHSKRVDLLRWYGLDRKVESRISQNISEWGFKFHMNDIAATIGLSNIRHLEWIVSRHAANAERLRVSLQMDGIRHLESRKDCFSASWIFTMRVERREDFIRKLRENGISTDIVHSRNDIHTCLREFAEDLPGTNKISGEMCCIPCGWWLNETDLNHIISTIQSGW